MMWIDSENINISISAAILITGGDGAEQSAEVFLPWSNTTCQLPSLPDKRAEHLQAGALLHQQPAAVWPHLPGGVVQGRAALTVLQRPDTVRGH